MYILAVIEDDEFQFVIGEIDTYSNQSDLRLKSFHILNYKISAIVSYVSLSRVEQKKFCLVIK